MCPDASKIRSALNVSSELATLKSNSQRRTHSEGKPGKGLALAGVASAVWNADRRNISFYNVAAVCITWTQDVEVNLEEVLQVRPRLSKRTNVLSRTTRPVATHSCSANNNDSKTPEVVESEPGIS